MLNSMHAQEDQLAAALQESWSDSRVGRREAADLAAWQKRAREHKHDGTEDTGQQSTLSSWLEDHMQVASSATESSAPRHAICQVASPLSLALDLLLAD